MYIIHGNENKKIIVSNMNISLNMINELCKGHIPIIDEAVS